MRASRRARASGALRPLIRVAAAAAATVAIAVGAGVAIGGWDFARQHLGALAGAAAMLAASLTLGVRLVAGAIRGAILAARRPRALGQSGAAAAEFVIVVIPFLTMLFGVMQMALASLARVLVSYSAFCAARAAIVFVPQDGATTQNIPLPTATTSESAGQIGKGSDTLTDFATSAKAAKLRNAASYALIPSSPAIDIVIADTVRNFPGYIVQRATHGLSPLDWLKSTIGDLSGYPQSVVDALNGKLQDAINNLGTKGANATKTDLDNWIKANVSDPTKQAMLKNAVDSLIDNMSQAGTGAAGGWATGLISSTLSGPLAQFQDQINQWTQGAAQGAGGNLAGGFTGSSVGKALDEGFGADTDGAGGALLRSLRKLIYARMATVVTLHDPATGNLKTNFGAQDPIQAKVTYLFYCQIPIANKFAGKPFYDLPDQTVMSMTTGPLGPVAMVGIPGYFMTLTATHTLTNQGKP